MIRSPLQNEIAARAKSDVQPPRESEYRGVITAPRFSDPQQEFRALVSGCGVYDLGFRTRILAKGEDRVRWMNGMVTNNVRDLEAGHGVYAFLLNPQGRILGDMLIHNHGDSLMVETDRSQAEKIIATFNHYIIMDDVEVSNAGETWTAVGVSGPKSRAVLNAAGIQVAEIQPLQEITPRCDCDCGCVKCTVVRAEDAKRESYEIWLAPKDVYKTWQALISAGATPVGHEALEIARIVAGIPLYGVDIRERDLPQETEQMRALNFNKGCYVGQEIVERIRSRGNVHRKFTGFLTDGPGSVAPGAKILADEKEVGEVTSVAVLCTANGDRTVALGYIRREAGEPGRRVAIGSETGSTVQLPLDENLLGRLNSGPAEQVLSQAR